MGGGCKGGVSIPIIYIIKGVFCSHFAQNKIYVFEMNKKFDFFGLALFFILKKCVFKDVRVDKHFIIEEKRQ